MLRSGLIPRCNASSMDCCAEGKLCNARDAVALTAGRISDGACVDGERWYVAYTQPHREARAQAHLVFQGFRTFLPHNRKTVRHARKLRTVSSPLFPRY